MKNNKSYWFWGYAVFFATAMLFLCDNEISSTPLIAGLPSGITIDSVCSLLSIEKDSLRLEENEGFDDTDKRGPYSFCKYSFPMFADFGIEGNLAFHLYNGKLFATWFYPDDFQRYFDSLTSRKKISLDDNKDVTLKPHTKIWTATDYEGRKYIGWEDIRLSREYSEWLKKNS